MQKPRDSIVFQCEILHWSHCLYSVHVKMAVSLLSVSKFLPEEVVEESSKRRSFSNMRKVLPSWPTYQLCFFSISETPCSSFNVFSFFSFFFGWRGRSSRFAAWGKRSVCRAIVILHRKTKQKIITVTYKSEWSPSVSDCEPGALYAACPLHCYDVKSPLKGEQSFWKTKNKKK